MTFRSTEQPGEDSYFERNAACVEEVGGSEQYWDVIRRGTKLQASYRDKFFFVCLSYEMSFEQFSQQRTVGFSER
jgi:hypothetical protein